MEVPLLPFLKPRQEPQVSGLIIKHRMPDEKSEDNQDDPAAGIMACAKDLMDAVHSKDIKGIADALSDAFEILDKGPQEETSKHDYAAQNEKAAEESNE